MQSWLRSTLHGYDGLLSIVNRWAARNQERARGKKDSKKERPMKDQDVHTRESSGFRQYLLVLAAILCVCLLASVSAIAQVTTADVLGTVTDNSGAVVPDAKVTITNIGTNDARSGHTNSAGEYVFTLLLPGRYSVRVESANFKAFIANVTVSAGDRARVDAPLQVGS